MLKKKTMSLPIHCPRHRHNSVQHLPALQFQSSSSTAGAWSMEGNCSLRWSQAAACPQSGPVAQTRARDDAGGAAGPHDIWPCTTKIHIMSCQIQAQFCPQGIVMSNSNILISCLCSVKPCKLLPPMAMGTASQVWHNHGHRHSRCNHMHWPLSSQKQHNSGHPAPTFPDTLPSRTIPTLNPDIGSQISVFRRLFQTRYDGRSRRISSKISASKMRSPQSSACHTHCNNGGKKHV